VAGRGYIWRQLKLDGASFVKNVKQEEYAGTHWRMHGEQKGNFLERLLVMDGGVEIIDGDIIHDEFGVMFHKNLIQRIKEGYEGIVGRNVPHNSWGYMECKCSPESVLHLPRPFSTLDLGFGFNFGGNAFDKPDFLIANPLRDDGTGVLRRKHSSNLLESKEKGNPGAIVQERLEGYLDISMTGFGTMSAWQVGGLYDSEINTPIIWREGERERVAREKYGDEKIKISRVLLMDEPTALLSYRRKHAFRARIEELIKRNDSLQIFIATNDAALIEYGGDDYRFINFDCKPAVSQLRYGFGE